MSAEAARMPEPEYQSFWQSTPPPLGSAGASLALGVVGMPDEEANPLHTSINFRPGPGAPVNAKPNNRFAAACRGFCIELVHRDGVCISGPGAATPTPEDLRVMCPNLAQQRAEGERIIGLCDRAFRASHSTWDWSRVNRREGGPMIRTSFFDAACKCFVTRDAPKVEDDFCDVFEDPNFEINFAAFSEILCGKEVSVDAYGRPGDVIKLATEAQRCFSKASKLTSDLVDEMRKHRQMGSPACIYNYKDAQEKLKRTLDAMELCDQFGSQHHLNSLSTFKQLIESRAAVLKSGHTTWNLLKARLDQHLCDRRVADQHFMEDVSGDVLCVVARYLDPHAACALMRTCKGCNTDRDLQDRLPHLRIRPIIGSFPHSRSSSKDRADLALNKNRAVMRDFIVARQVVRIYVDFVQPVMRSTPLAKKERTDGLDNKDHDFSDDEYEDAPESKRTRAPAVNASNLDATTEWGRRQLDHETRRHSLWNQADGPEEPPDRYSYHQRLSYTPFFTDALAIKPSLVYADTYEEVPCDLGQGGLEYSNALVNDGGTFRQPARWSAQHMPAQAKFHIPHLSLDHAGRLFRLRLCGTGKLATSGGDFEQVVYSEPFEVVSKVDVVKMAYKRRTADQMKEHCRERENKRAKQEASKKESFRAFKPTVSHA